jgi:transcription initiation factor TFIIIB Brf1 subunit/transcription initiation factor TFIIB
VHKIWQNQPDVAALIASEASRMIKSACKSKPTFFSGKTEKGILSGLLYHLGLVRNHVKTQRQIARSLNTNEVTVRESWRDWLNEFPELSEDLEERKA